METTNFTTTILVEKAQKKYSMPSTMFELVCNEIKKQIVALTTRYLNQIHDSNERQHWFLVKLAFLFISS